MVRGKVLIGILFAAFMSALGARSQPVSTTVSDSLPPLNMLTYDHGGLILWGRDHFRERLENAVSWLEKYPGFKIGLDNEAQIYDVFAETDLRGGGNGVVSDPVHFTPWQIRTMRIDSGGP